jgi:hypothetical protein
VAHICACALGDHLDDDASEALIWTYQLALARAAISGPVSRVGRVQAVSGPRGVPDPRAPKAAPIPSYSMS